MKFFEVPDSASGIKSLPSRECGLKWKQHAENLDSLIVTPFAGVWIEIPLCGLGSTDVKVTPFAGVWIEIDDYKALIEALRSHSLRGSVD